jgi:ribonuclease HI
MPWIKATLRGQTVFARASASGTLLPGADGRVEVRYKPMDGKAYFAGQKNLEPIAGQVLPDETCGPAEAPAPKEKAGSAKSPSAKKSAAAAAASATPIPKDAWIAYADGACTGNPGPCGLGVVLVGPDGKMKESYEYLGEGTNNIAELTAVLRAVQAVPRDAPALVLHTDSQYSIGVLSKGWKAKANQTLILEVKKELAAYGKTRFVYVPGHAGVPLNERADELAREAVKTRGKQLL